MAQTPWVLASTAFLVDVLARCGNFVSARFTDCSLRAAIRHASHPSVGYVSTHARELSEPRPVTAARAIDPDALDQTLQRELSAAGRRLAELRVRREQLERELDAAAAAEAQAHEALAALRSIAIRAGLDLGEQEARDAGAELAEHPGRRRLAGAALRETVTRVALRRNAHGRPIHWRTWYGWLHESGFDAAGKRPEATFLTQLGRSPLVCRGEQEGVYVLDVELLNRRRAELVELTRRLGDLPPPDQLALIGDVRSERRETQQQIARAERRLEEAWRTLAEELGEDAPDPGQLLERWRRRSTAT